MVCCLVGSERPRHVRKGAGLGSMKGVNAVRTTVLISRSNLAIPESAR